MTALVWVAAIACLMLFGELVDLYGVTHPGRAVVISFGALAVIGMLALSFS